MTLSTFLYYLFGITSISYIIHLGVYLIGASFYDIWQHYRIHKIANEASTDLHTLHVSVLVPAHNEEKVIARCLDSIFQSTYPNIDVIVINDASTDTTKRTLLQYKLLHPTRALRSIHKRLNVGKGAALNYALRRYAQGELIMSLDGDSILSPQAIEKSVSYFSNPAIVGVAANVQIMNQHTTLSILQKLEHMIGYRSKKFYSLTNCEYVIGGVASTYRRDVMRSVGYYDTDTLTEDISLSLKIVAKGNLTQRLVYGSDVMAMTEPVENLAALFRQRFRWKYGSLQNILKHSDLIGKSDTRFSTMLTMYRLPMAIMSELALLALPLTWFYAIYLTITEKTILIILGAYATVTVYVLIVLWHNEHLRRLERAYLTIYTPLAYFIFYIMDVIQLIAIIKCLAKIRNLRTHSNVGSTWISPTRIGTEMSIATMSQGTSGIKPINTARRVE